MGRCAEIGFRCYQTHRSIGQLVGAGVIRFRRTDFRTREKEIREFLALLDFGDAESLLDDWFGLAMHSEADHHLGGITPYLDDLSGAKEFRCP